MRTGRPCYGDTEGHSPAGREEKETIMRSFKGLVCGLLFASAIGAPVRAHFGMLLPGSTSAARDKPVPLLFRWGHPFEHEVFDAPKPERLLARTPDGKQADLTKLLEQAEVPGA